jgi:hypothetical protein
MKLIGGMLIVLAVSGVMAQTNWTVQKTVPRSQMDLFSVHKVNNLFVGFGSMNISGNMRNVIFTSSDGISWTFRANVPNPINSISYTFSSIAYTGSKYVAVGLYGTIAISTDGTDWKLYTIAYNQYSVKLNSIAWSGNKLIAIGNRGFFSSTDGIAWTVSSYGGVFNSLIWTGSKFITVGDSGKYASSNDGTNWNIGYVSLPVSLTSVVWTGAFIVATSDNGGSFVSTDGSSWTVAATPIPSTASSLNFKQLIWSGKSLVQIVQPNIINISKDGINWNMQTLPQVSILNTIVFTGTNFIAYGYTGSSNDSLIILTAPLDENGASPLAKKSFTAFDAKFCTSGPTTMVRYSLAEPSRVSLRIVDMVGRQVFSGINQVQAPGAYVFQVPPSLCAAGKYVQVFEAGTFTKSELVTVRR